LTALQASGPAAEGAHGGLHASQPTFTNTRGRHANHANPTTIEKTLILGEINNILYFCNRLPIGNATLVLAVNNVVSVSY
jgi:hypothetical protein